MSACRPLIPTGVFRADNRPVAVDIQNLVDQFTNPLLRYDQKQIRLNTVLTNALLFNMQQSDENAIRAGVPDRTVFSNYPALQQRFEQSAITEEEFSDFLASRGLTPNYVQETYENDYPIDINIDAINEAINNVTDALNETLAQIVSDNNTSSISPPDEEDVTQAADNGELDQFDPSVPLTDLLEWQPTEDMDNVLNEMDRYYSENYGVLLNKSDACAALTNPFTKLSSLIAAAASLATLAEGAVDFATELKGKIDGLVDSIRNFSFESLISGLAGKLANLKAEVLGIFDSALADARARLDNLRNTAMSLIEDINGLPRAAHLLLLKKTRQIEDFLNELNEGDIRSKIKSIFTINEDQFEDLLPAVLTLLTLKACAIGNFVDAIVRKPLDDFNDLLGLMSVNFNIMENLSIDRLNRVLDAGALRLGRAERQERRERQAENANRISRSRVTTPGADAADGQPPAALEPSTHIVRDLSPGEARFVSSITRDYDNYFKFTDDVKNMGVRAREVYESGGNGVLDHWREWDEGENGPDAGWKMIAERHPYIYVALARVSRKLTEEGLLHGPLIISSAFRSRYYNRVVLAGQGAAQNSLHMHAMAIDIDDDASGLSSAGSAMLVDFLSQEGFTRFGIYSGFIHADIGTGPTALIFRNDRTGDRNMATAIELHRSRAS